MCWTFGFFRVNEQPYFMKMRFLVILTVAAGMALPGRAVPDTNANASFKTDKEKISYSIGVNIGTAMKNQQFDVDVETVSSAIKDVLGGRDVKLTPQQAMENIRAYQKDLMTKRMEEQKKLAEKNKKEGETFLAANKAKPGVKAHEVKLVDGSTAELQYKVIKEGTGEIPKSNDLVEVTFRGTTPDGKEFANSTKNPGMPPRAASAGVMGTRGTGEALQMMKVGSKWEVYMPSSLAYNDNQGPGVEPGSPVIFELELTGVKAPPPPPPPPQPLTSDIIKVPSAEEMKKGAKIEVLKPEDVEKAKKEQEEKERKEKQQKTP
jgi:FKBP-type peptidyl-prolyl cis-trans isomerase